MRHLIEVGAEQFRVDHGDLFLSSNHCTQNRAAQKEHAVVNGHC
jgi:hypothetical protein